MMQLSMATRQLTKQFGRSNSTIAGTVYYRCSYHNPERVALICPSEKIKWTYGELWENVLTVAGGLTQAGYGPGSVIATDLDRNTPALLLQMAVAHNQMQLLTVKNEDEYKRLGAAVSVDGAVATSGSFLQGPTVADLQKSGGKAGEGCTDRDSPLAYFGSSDVTGNRQVYLHGVGIAGLLQIKPGEQVCVAASLNNSFGIGAVLSAIVRSGVIYLPDPKSPDLGDSAILIADEENVDALQGKKSKNLRAGLVKRGAYNYQTGIPEISGSSEVAGVTVYDLSATGTHPLFDACSDTFYPPGVVA